MNRTRLSDYTILSLSAYITIFGVYLMIIGGYEAGQQIGLTGMFLAFGVLNALYFRYENDLRIINLLLGLNTALVLVIFFYAGLNFDVGTLLFVLSAYSMLFLPVRNGLLWVAMFTVIVGSLGYIEGGFPVLMSMISMGGGFAFFAFVGSSLRRSDQARRESDRLLIELQEAHRQLQAYAAQAEQLAVSEERNRLAREMHDALGHRLTVAVVQLEGAQRLIPREPERAATMVGTMREQIKIALQELRQTVSALRNPAEEELALEEAIERLVATFQTATGLVVHVTIARDMPELPSAHRLTLFRAIQECLTNVQRHAGANESWLDLSSQNGTVTLTVADDGKGFPEVIGDGRFGLAGLRERTEALGGSVDFESRQEGGAAVRLQIPVQPVGESRP